MSLVSSRKIFEAFTDQEFLDIELAAIINPADNPADQLKSAKIKRLIDGIRTDGGMKMYDSYTDSLAILVSEGIITGIRLAEIIQNLKDGT